MNVVIAAGLTSMTPSPTVQVALYSLAIVAATLAAAYLSLERLGHTPMQAIISFVGGLMLGIAVFHLWPHALGHMGEGRADEVATWVMAGILLMFLLLRAFHFHQHGPSDFGPGDTGHSHDCDRDHAAKAESHLHAKPAGTRAPTKHRWEWVGVFAGLAIHTLIDGIALAASVQVGQVLSPSAGWFGLGAFAAILLHKPLDTLSITTLMTSGGWSRKSQLIVVCLFALMCPAGALIFMGGVGTFGLAQSPIVGCALAFACGVFLCISLSDLLPEMEFHSHNRALLTTALLLGIAMAWGIRLLESRPAPPARPAINAVLPPDQLAGDYRADNERRNATPWVMSSIASADSRRMVSQPA
jgi:zinc and cadmium transporter